MNRIAHMETGNRNNESSLSKCICGKTSFVRSHGPYWDATINAQYIIAKCLNCKLNRTLPPPYQEDVSASIYQELPLESVRDHEQEWRGYFAPILAAVRKHKTNGRLLDVGCGPGLMVKMAGEQGYHATGVEINVRSAQYAREQLGLDVHIGDVKHASFSKGEFDIAILSHVLEHLSDPIGVFEEIARVMKPDGIVVIEVPNKNGLQAKLLRDRWSGWAPFMHVWQFDPDTLRTTVQTLGFDPIEISCKNNFSMGIPSQAWKRLLRYAGWPVVDSTARLLNRGDKVLCIARNRSYGAS